MNETLEFIADRIVGLCQQAGAQVDLEVLQWPGGSFIALLLLIRATLPFAVSTRSRGSISLGYVCRIPTECRGSQFRRQRSAANRRITRRLGQHVSPRSCAPAADAF